jgi:hypothetical protein
LADLKIPERLLALLTFCFRSVNSGRPLSSSPSSTSRGGSAKEIFCAGLEDRVWDGVGMGDETDCRLAGTGGGWSNGTS